MESKIQKLVIYYDEILGKDRDVRILDMANKIDEIIDHLNSQDQEEETRVRIYKDWQTPKGWVDEVTKVEVEDTQEGWKEVNKDIWYMVGGKKYVNINGEEYIRTSDLEQLLDEREREAEENLLKRLYSAKSKKEFRDMLDKLNKKK